MYYPGLEVLPPFVAYNATRIDEAAFLKICDELGKRLDHLESTQPIPFRPQNKGDYEIPALTLKSHLAPNQTGLSVHLQTMN